MLRLCCYIFCCLLSAAKGKRLTLNVWLCWCVSQDRTLIGIVSKAIFKLCPGEMADGLFVWQWWRLSVPPDSALPPHRSPLAFGTSFPWHVSWRQMCPPALLCMYPSSKSSLDYFIVSLLSQRPQTICIWDVEQGSANVNYHRCVWVMLRRGTGEHIRAEVQLSCQWIGEQQRARQWEEGWRIRIKMVKWSVAC